MEKQGTGICLEFLREVATAAGLPVLSARLALDGLRQALVRNLPRKKYCRIPDIVVLKVRTYPATPASTTCFEGRIINFKAKVHATRRVAGVALDPLRKAIE
jgi:hypothetical protein